MTSLHSAEHKRLIFIPEFRRLSVALTQKAHRQAQLRLLAQGPSRPCSFYTEAIWFLEIKTTEKQEQGCQGFLTCCLGLFISSSSTHIISDTALQLPGHSQRERLLRVTEVQPTSD